MTSPPSTNTCPQCRAALPADAPQGLCPACLLAAVAEPTEAGTAPLPKAPPPTREQVAAAFPQLEILELIGAGGMGHVFKARQPKLDRLVALKLLPQSLAADPAFAGRFEREGRILARLSHPNIVTVHDFGFARAGDLQSPFPSPHPPTDGDSKSPALPQTPNAQLETGFYYLLMEFVDGVNLRQAMRAGRFTSVQALEVVPKICEALQFAHEQGILHRDIKPENILLDAKGRVKLVDFGIAKMLRSESNGDTPVPDDSATPPQTPDPIPHSLPAAALTSATAALGTPSYMAPEQRDHPADVDHRADIYSLGVVFYEMLTGELPVGKFAPPSAKSASDPRVDQVVLRALEQQRERRQQSAGEVKSQVETIASSPGSSRREEAEPNAERGMRNAESPDAHARDASGQPFFATLLGALVVAGIIALLVHNSRQVSAPNLPGIPAQLRAAVAKQFTPARFTNMVGTASLWVETPLHPGESVRTYLVHPDGRRESATAMEFLHQSLGRERTTLSWGWRPTPPFTTNHADAIITELRARWEGKLLACVPGVPVNLFTITNDHGARLSGEVVFDRVLPVPAKPAVAEVRLSRVSGLSYVAVNFGAVVPAGYALHIGSAGDGSRMAHTSLVRNATGEDHCAWMWPGSDFGGELAQGVRSQVEALTARGPLLVTNGQPRTVFSATNNAGWIYNGYFELRGPDYVPPPVPTTLRLPQRTPSASLPPLPPTSLRQSLPTPPDLRPAEPAKPSTPEATALLTKLRQQYANATNLAVEGRTATTMDRPGQPLFEQSNKFEVKLGRPSLYLVHWTSSPIGTHVHEGAAWSQGEGDWFWMNAQAPVRQESRRRALGGGGGVSHRVTSWLPDLFFGNAAWVSVLRELRSEPDEDVDGEPCAVLVGTSRGNTTRLWVSKRDFFLRQAEHLGTVTADQVDRIPSGTMTAGTTIRTVQTYRVVAGQALIPSDFKFTPPADK